MENTSWVLITGASGGIGMELARVFAREKFSLVLCARRESELVKLKSELEAQKDVQVLVKSLDLSVDTAPQALFDWTQSKSIHISVLVNNAGFGDYGLFRLQDWKRVDEMIRLNVLTLAHLSHLYLPNMVEKKYGRILNVASTAAFQPGPLMAVYYASKAFVLSLSEALSNECIGTGVTVTALCPGPTESGFQKAASLDGSGLFKNRKIPSSADVAEYAYKALMAGKSVAIHGALNFLLTQSVRLAPRSLITKVVRRIQEVR